MTGTSSTVTTVSTRRLRWCPKQREFTTDSWALGWPDDLFPFSINVVSHSTRQTRTFHYVGTDYDTIRDIQILRYEYPDLVLMVEIH